VLQSVEKPQDPCDFQAAIEDVAEEYHVPLSPDPVTVRVDESSVSQKTEDSLELSMLISHHEEEIHIGEDYGEPQPLVVQIQHCLMEILSVRQSTVAQKRRISTRAWKRREARLSKRCLDSVDQATFGDTLQDALLGAGCEPPHSELAPAVYHPESIFSIEPRLGAGRR
jgi:hypothetical protein